MSLPYFERVEYGKMIRHPHAKFLEIGLYRGGAFEIPCLTHVDIDCLEGSLPLVPEKLYVRLYRMRGGRLLRAIKRVSIKRIEYVPETVIIDCPGKVSLGKHMKYSPETKRGIFSVNASEIRDFYGATILHRDPERLVSLRACGENVFSEIALYPNLDSLDIRCKEPTKKKRVLSHPNLSDLCVKGRVSGLSGDVEIRDCPKLNRLCITNQSCVLKNLVLSEVHIFGFPIRVKLVNCIIKSLYINTPHNLTFESENSSVGDLIMRETPERIESVRCALVVDRVI